MSPKAVSASFLNRSSLARVLFLLADTTTDTGRLSSATKTLVRKVTSRQRKPNLLRRRFLCRLLMGSHPSLRHRDRHHIREPSRRPDARKFQSHRAAGPGGPGSATITKPHHSNPSTPRGGCIPDGTMGVGRKNSVRVLDSRPGSSRRRLSNLGEVSTPNRGYRTEESEGRFETNRYSFAVSFVGHLIETYTAV